MLKQIVSLRFALIVAIAFTQMFESSFVFITGTLNSLRTNSRRNRHATKVITKETWLLANYDPVVQRDKLFDELMLVSTFLASLAHPTPSQAIEPQLASPNIFEIQDANTYSAVVYIPPQKKHKSQRIDGDSLPLILLLHGAGINQHSALYEFTLLDLPRLRPGITHNFHFFYCKKTKHPPP